MTDLRVAYIVSRFPRLTETFILNEVMAVRSSGLDVDLFALRHHYERVAQPGSRELEACVRYAQYLEGLRLMARDTYTLAPLLGMTTQACAGSPRCFAKSVLALAAGVAWAGEMHRLGIGHVHAHFGTYPALAALVAAKLLEVGFSFTVHAHDLFAEKAMLAEKMRQARFVVTVSDFNRRRLGALVGPEEAARIRVIRCGVDVSSFGFRLRRQPPATHTLVSVAALREYKGLTHLVEACALLRATVPDERFVCWIVGDGPERGRLAKEIRNAGLENSVVLLGAADCAKVRRLLDRADVFVLPAVIARNGYMDAIPVALMEAMASGVPVVASDLSGIPELVRHADTGLLVPPANAARLRDAILRCWREPTEAAERSIRARRLVEREYDLHTNAAQLVAEFRGVHVKRPSPTSVTIAGR